jgi:hypothetical protein
LPSDISIDLNNEPVKDDDFDSDDSLNDLRKAP